MNEYSRISSSGLQHRIWIIHFTDVRRGQWDRLVCDGRGFLLEVEWAGVEAAEGGRRGRGEEKEEKSGTGGDATEVRE